jgi:hypothetical protein
MHLRRVPRTSPVEHMFPSSTAGRTRGEEAPRAPQQVVNIDELSTSPWIGLHYRHEFLLHYRHELLEQHLNE